MLFNLYLISSSISIDAASLLINFVHARVRGLLLWKASKLIFALSWFDSLSSASFSSSWVSWSSWVFSFGMNSLRRFTFSVFVLLFCSLIFATDSLISMIVAGPIHFGANFLLTFRKSVWEYQTCCPIEKVWGSAFLSCWCLYFSWLFSMLVFAISLAYWRIWSLSDAKDSP